MTALEAEASILGRSTQREASPGRVLEWDGVAWHCWEGERLLRILRVHEDGWYQLVHDNGRSTR